jgi:hypothetical protein
MTVRWGPVPTSTVMMSDMQKLGRLEWGASSGGWDGKVGGGGGFFLAVGLMMDGAGNEGGGRTMEAL